MVTDEQGRRLRKLSNTEKDQEIAASKAGMDPTTARKYLGLERLPSELKRERHWRTREDPFSQVWDAVQRQVQESPRLEAKDVVRVAATGIPRAVQRWADPDPATADQAVAGHGGSSPRGGLRPERHAGKAGRVGLHSHGRV